MRHLIKNFVLVALSYSMALSTPAAAKPVDGFVVVKDYVNSSGKKSFMAVLQKMEKELPSNFYEQLIKNLKGQDGKLWFQAAKLADNYSYFRINNSKVFIRTTTEKGKTVFYANGVRIDEADLSTKGMKLAEIKLIRAYAKGFSKSKSAFLDFFKLSESTASTKFEPVEETAKGTGTPVATQDDGCAAIKAQYEEMKAENPAYADQYAKGTPTNCGLLASGGTGGTPVAAAGQPNMWIIAAIIAAFLLLMLSKKKKKKTSETPETECGVGRGLGADGKCVPRPTPPPTGGHVNCDPNGQCPGGTTEPGNPTPPPTTTTPISDDPNYYGESTIGTGRSESSTTVPSLKTKGKK